MSNGPLQTISSVTPKQDGPEHKDRHLTTEETAGRPREILRPSLLSRASVCPTSHYVAGSRPRTYVPGPGAGLSCGRAPAVPRCRSSNLPPARLKETWQRASGATSPSFPPNEATASFVEPLGVGLLLVMVPPGEELAPRATFRWIRLRSEC